MKVLLAVTGLLAVGFVLEIDTPKAIAQQSAFRVVSAEEPVITVDAKGPRTVMDGIRFRDVFEETPVAGRNLETLVRAPQGSPPEPPAALILCDEIADEACDASGTSKTCCLRAKCDCGRFRYSLLHPPHMAPPLRLLEVVSTYYYFRPYNWRHVKDQQEEAIHWGAPAENPYSNQIFQEVYDSFESN